ncbi:adhesion G-protein coupled receptor G7-like [Symphorus nematophorus]
MCRLEDCQSICNKPAALSTHSFQHSSQNEIISRRPRRAHSSPPLPNGSASSQAATRRREDGRISFYFSSYYSCSSFYYSSSYYSYSSFYYSSYYYSSSSFYFSSYYYFSSSSYYSFSYYSYSSFYYSSSYYFSSSSYYSFYSSSYYSCSSFYYYSSYYSCSSFYYSYYYYFSSSSYYSFSYYSYSSFYSSSSYYYSSPSTPPPPTTSHPSPTTLPPTTPVPPSTTPPPTTPVPPSTTPPPTTSHPPPTTPSPTTPIPPSTTPPPTTPVPPSTIPPPTNPIPPSTTPIPPTTPVPPSTPPTTTPTTPVPPSTTPPPTTSPHPPSTPSPPTTTSTSTSLATVAPSTLPPTTPIPPSTPPPPITPVPPSTTPVPTSPTTSSTSSSVATVAPSTPPPTATGPPSTPPTTTPIPPSTTPPSTTPVPPSTTPPTTPVPPSTPPPTTTPHPPSTPPPPTTPVPPSTPPPPTTPRPPSTPPPPTTPVPPSTPPPPTTPHPPSTPPPPTTPVPPSTPPPPTTPHPPSTPRPPTTPRPPSTPRPATTTSPTTITPPTTTPLVCENGGIPLHGVCICPDEWTGERCSEENFCPAQNLGEFSFPRTPIGWFAYSEEICPKGTSGAGKPRATTRCFLKNGSPSFESAQEFKCDQTLSDVQQNLTSPADLESLATSTQILTSKPEELTAENITTAAQIANSLLLSPNATETVRVAAVATVSQLLNASTPEDSTENNSTLRLTLTLDELSRNLSLILNTSESQVVQPNLVVQSAQVPVANTQGVQFMSLSGTSGSFVADRIKLNTNTSKVVVDDGGIAEALIHIRFPQEAVRGRQKPSNVSLGFVLYQNDRFFQSRRYKSQRSTIRVLSGSVSGQEHSVVPQHVEMMFRPITVDGMSLYDFACVFWNYSLDEWSTDGCSKGNTSDGLVTCFCNHTTNFAALWVFREKYEYAEALDWISIIGLSVSILGLVLTIIHHIKENFYRRSHNTNSKIAQLCIYVSLLAFIITFLSGVENYAPVNGDSQTNSIPDSDERMEPDRGSCTAVAALLHFFLLATFMWSGIYGTQLVVLFRSRLGILPRHWAKFSLAVGWGVPAVIMAITLGVTYRVEKPLEYRQEEFCWLAALDKAKRFHFEKPMFWGFILPVGLILIYNILVMILASPMIFRADPTKKRSMANKILVSFSLAMLLGLSWTLGYLVLATSGHTHLIFSIVFCLCTTTQGLQIFILFTARTRSFKATVSQSVSSFTTQLNNMVYSLWKKPEGTQ